jgi:hypothetical protein
MSDKRSPAVGSLVHATTGGYFHAGIKIDKASRDAALVRYRGLASKPASKLTDLEKVQLAHLKPMFFGIDEAEVQTRREIVERLDRAAVRDRGAVQGITRELEAFDRAHPGARLFGLGQTLGPRRARKLGLPTTSTRSR